MELIPVKNMNILQKAAMYLVIDNWGSRNAEIEQLWYRRPFEHFTLAQIQVVTDQLAALTDEQLQLVCMGDRDEACKLLPEGSDADNLLNCMFGEYP